MGEKNTYQVETENKVFFVTSIWRNYNDYNDSFIQFTQMYKGRACTLILPTSRVLSISAIPDEEDLD